MVQQKEGRLDIMDTLDFNGDGQLDFLLGSPGHAVPEFRSGAVYVLMACDP